MPKKRITIELDSKIISKLERRAKRDMFSLRELIEDIIRRSAISGKTYTISGDSDDTLVGIFSRKTRKKGRK